MNILFNLFNELKMLLQNWQQQIFFIIFYLYLYQPFAFVTVLKIGQLWSSGQCSWIFYEASSYNCSSFEEVYDNDLLSENLYFAQFLTLTWVVIMYEKIRKILKYFPHKYHKVISLNWVDLSWECLDARGRLERLCVVVVRHVMIAFGMKIHFR